MLQFGLAAALEVLHATIGSEACWIPETHWVLHSELVLERTQGRCGVVGPVTPGASGETILCTRRLENSAVSTKESKRQLQSAEKSLKESCALCLEEHTDDRHHRETAVCQLGRQLFRLLSRIR